MGVTAVLGAVSAISAVGSYMESQEQTAILEQSAQEQATALLEQSAATKEAQAAQARAAQVESQRERIKQIREARIRRASVLAGAGAMGLGAGTSGTIGAVSAIGSQAAENIGTINQMQSFGEQATEALQRATDAGDRATRSKLVSQAKIGESQANQSMWGSVGSVAGSIFQQKGGFTSLFGGNTFDKAK